MEQDLVISDIGKVVSKYKIMRILFPIGTLYPSEKGGPSNTVYWIAKELHLMKIDVTCISTNFGIDTNKLEFDRWLKTDYGDVVYTSDRFHNFPYKLLLRSIYKLKESDIIHLTSIFYPPSWIIAPISIFKKKKIIWSVRGNFEQDAMKISRWKKKPILWLVKKIAHNTNIIFHTTSTSETNNTKLLLGNNVKIIEIPNYIEMPNTEPRDCTIDPYFLYIGRIHPIKAIDKLIEALSSSKLFQESSYILKIVGEGEKDYVESLKKLSKRLGCESRVHFINHVTGIEKQKLYANAHFTFLISYSENFGNVVIESLAQGTPVVASTGTPWSILIKENAGFWINNDSKSLKQTIDDIIILKPNKYENLRTNAYRIVKKEFDIKCNIQKWIEIYSKWLQ